MSEFSTIQPSMYAFQSLNIYKVILFLLSIFWLYYFIYLFIYLFIYASFYFVLFKKDILE